MNILIPMAGDGRRFRDAGYDLPKPLLPVAGRPMIARVVENLREGVGADRAKFIFIVRQEHHKLGVTDLLEQIAPGCIFLSVPELTEGAAVTALVAQPWIDTDRPLLIANSDQLVDWPARRPALLEQLYGLDSLDWDAALYTFHSEAGDKYSFCVGEPLAFNCTRRSGTYRVSEVVEKRKVSDIANTGIYWFRRGRDFVRSAERMIARNLRTNGEFYLAPCFNQLLETGAFVGAEHCPSFYCLGDPESYEAFQTLMAVSPFAAPWEARP